MTNRNKIYFGKQTQQAIIDYNNETDIRIRNRLYMEHIYPAFLKLAENIIFTFKFSYFNDSWSDVKNDVVSHMTIKLPYFKPEKGKAYSYFSVIAKYYLIAINNRNWKKQKTHTPIIDDIHGNISSNGNGDSDFIHYVIEYFESNIDDLFRFDRDKNIAYAIVELMRRSNSLESLHKKVLYIYVREITNVKQVKISAVVKVMKHQYKKFAKEYYNTGKLLQNEYKQTNSIEEKIE